MRYMETSRHHTYWAATFWPLFFGGLMLLPMALTEPLVFVARGYTLFFIFMIALVPTFMAYLFFSEGLRSVRAHDAPIIMILVEPLSALFLSSLVLGEILTYNIFLGGGLILMANLVVEVHLKRRAKRYEHLTVKVPVAKPLAARGPKKAHELALMKSYSRKYRERFKRIFRGKRKFPGFHLL